MLNKKLFRLVFTFCVVSLIGYLAFFTQDVSTAHVPSPAAQQPTQIDREPPRQTHTATLGMTPNLAQQPTDEVMKRTLFGRVINQAGHPVSGADVFLVNAQDPVQKSHKVISQSSGTFTFEHIAVGTYQLYAAHENQLSFGHVDEIQTLEVTAEDHSIGPLTLTFQSAFQLNITVVDDRNDEPIAGAEVISLSPVRLSELTDDRGQTNFALIAGSWMFAVRATGFAQKHLLMSVVSHKQHIKIRLQLGGSVWGQVTDQDGAPIAQADVYARDNMRLGMVQTDKLGQYRLENLPLDRYFTVVAGKENFRWQHKQVAPTGLAPSERELNFTLKSGESIETTTHLKGRLLNPTGKPIVNGRIGVSLGGKGEGPATTSDANGNFELTVTNRYYFSLAAVADGYAYQVVSLQGQEKTDLEIVLQPSHQIQGVVVDEADTPVPEAYFKLYDHNGGRLFGGKILHTDQQGRFVVDQLPAEVTGTFWSSNHSIVRRTPLTASQESHLIRLPPQGCIFGYIRNKDGEPIAPSVIRVQMLDRSQPNLDDDFMDALKEKGMLFTDQDGFFSIPALNVGDPYLVIATAEGYGLLASTAWTVQRPEDPPLELVLESKSIEIAGHLIGPDQQALANQLVSVFTYGHEVRLRDSVDNFFQNDNHEHGLLDVHRTHTDKDGHFHFKGLAGNKALLIEGTVDGLLSIPQKNVQDLSPQARLNLLLQMKDSGMVYGLVNLEKFPQETKLTIGGTTDSGFFFESQKPEIDGSYQFKGVASGTYRISWIDPNQPKFLDGDEFTFTEGENLRIDLGFDSTYKLSGQVTVDQQPLVGGYVYIQPVDTHGVARQQSITNAEGRFIFQEVKPANYRLNYARPPENHAAEPERSSADYISFTMGDADQERLFAFNENGDVFGRLVPPPQGQKYVRLKPALGHELPDIRPFTTVRADGRFHFRDVPPGPYELQYIVRGNNYRERTIREGVMIPAGADNLDLGDIPMDYRGRITMTTNQAMDTYGVIYLFREDHGTPMNLPLERIHLTLSTETATLDDLAIGNYRVFFQPKRKAQFPVDNGIAIQVTEDEPVHIAWVLRPTTHLSNSLLLGSNVSYSSYRVTHTESGQQVQVIRADQAQWYRLIYAGILSRPSAVELERGFSAFNLKPGQYLIEAVGPDGPVQETIELIAGTLMEVGFH